MPKVNVPAISDSEAASLDARSLAKRYTKLALEQMVDVMVHGQNENAVVNAADKLLNRAWGQPNQPTEVSIGVFASLSDASRGAVIRALELVIERERGGALVLEGDGGGS